MDRYILAIDQSTQGTKAMLLDKEGALVQRDIRHIATLCGVNR